MEVLLYTKDSFIIDYTKYYIMLYVKGKDWEDIDAKSKRFCEENNFQLAGGFYHLWRPASTTEKIIIDIHDKNWKEKYDEAIGHIISKVI